MGHAGNLYTVTVELDHFRKSLKVVHYCLNKLPITATRSPVCLCCCEGAEAVWSLLNGTVAAGVAAVKTGEQCCRS